MFCNRCGTELPDADSQFCLKCSSLAAAAEAPTLGTDPYQVDQPQNRWKKALAYALIAVFAAMLLGLPIILYGQLQDKGKPAYHITLAIVIVLGIVGLYSSIRRLLRWNGWRNTCDQQAVAYFVAILCGSNLFCIPILVASLIAWAPSELAQLAPRLAVDILLFGAGFYAGIRWIRRSRQRERGPAVAFSKGVGASIIITGITGIAAFLSLAYLAVTLTGGALLPSMSALEWNKFSPRGETFSVLLPGPSVLLPGKPKEEIYSTEVNGIRLEGHSFSAWGGAAEFTVAYADSPVPVTAGKAEGLLDTPGCAGYKILSATKMTINGYPARRCRCMADEKGLQIDVLTVWYGRRLYILVVHHKGQDEADVERFFKSFTFTASE